MKFRAWVFSCSVLWRSARIECVCSILQREVPAEGILTHDLQILQTIPVSSCQHTSDHGMTVEVWQLSCVNEAHHLFEDLGIQFMASAQFFRLSCISCSNVALKTGERAARMALQALNSWPATTWQQSVKREFSHSSPRSLANICLGSLIAGVMFCPGLLKRVLICLPCSTGWAVVQEEIDVKHWTCNIFLNSLHVKWKVANDPLVTEFLNTDVCSLSLWLQGTLTFQLEVV